MESKDVVSFEEPAVPSRNRDVIAMSYVRKVLNRAAPEAIRFQRDLMNDKDADPKLRFQVSEALLDRFMGKAAQELRLGVAEPRPLVFNSKLQMLKDGFDAARDASLAHTSAYEAFKESVVDAVVDKEGVTI
jgi:hypothetical protein